MTELNLPGRRALVTGGAQGLGAGMARALAAAGAHRDDRRRPGRPRRRRSPTRSRRASSPLDVTDDAAVGVRGRARRSTELGGLDIVVNNAGIEITGLLVDTRSRADPPAMLEVNVLGTALGIKHAFRAMRPGGAAGNGGAVINVSSVAATIAFPGIAGYSATKSAVDRLTRVAAMETRQARLRRARQLRLPGAGADRDGRRLAVDMAALGLFGAPEAAVGAVVELTPSGRLGDGRRTWPTRWSSSRPTSRGSSTASACRSTAAWGCEESVMSEKKPVVVYGASGYTGRLICEYLREFHVPFIAAGRDESSAAPEVVDTSPASRRSTTRSPPSTTTSPRSPSCSGRVGRVQHGRPVHQATAPRSSRRAWPPAPTTSTRPASRTGLLDAAESAGARTSPTRACCSRPASRRCTRPARSPRTSRWRQPGLDTLDIARALEGLPDLRLHPDDLHDPQGRLGSTSSSRTSTSSGTTAPRASWWCPASTTSLSRCRGAARPHPVWFKQGPAGVERARSPAASSTAP